MLQLTESALSYTTRNSSLLLINIRKDLISMIVRNM